MHAQPKLWVVLHSTADFDAKVIIIIIIGTIYCIATTTSLILIQTHVKAPLVKKVRPSKVEAQK